MHDRLMPTAAGSAIAPESPSGSAEQAQPWAIVTALGAGAVVVSLDATKTAVALPLFGSDMGASLLQVQWMSVGYLVATTSMLLIAGRLGDRFGRRSAYLIGIALFATASALVGLAATVWLAVAARVLQGAAAALVLTNALSLLRTSVPTARIPGAVAVLASITITASAIGPLVGGLITAPLGWRWAFLINVPVAAIGWAVARRVLRQPARLDVPLRVNLTAGVGLAALLSSSIIALTMLPTRGWEPPWPLVCGVTAALGGATWVIAERHSREPLVPWALLRSRRVAAALTVTWCSNVMLIGTMLLLLLLLQNVYGASVLESAVRVLPVSVATVLGAAATRSVLRAVSARWRTAIGLSFAILGLASFALLTAPTDRAWFMTFGLILLGLGVGICNTTGVQVVLEASSADAAGGASGVVMTMSQLGGAVGVAVLGAAMSRAVNQVFPPAVQDAPGLAIDPDDLSAELISATVGQGLTPRSLLLDGGSSDALGAITAEAFVESLRTAVAVPAVLGIVVLTTVAGLGLRERTAARTR